MITVQEYAAKVGKSADLVRYYINRGKIAATKVPFSNRCGFRYLIEPPTNGNGGSGLMAKVKSLEDRIITLEARLEQFNEVIGH